MDREGRPALFRHYLAFEGDKDRAVELVRLHMSVNDGEAIEALAPVARNEFLRHEMKPGDVKQHV